MNGPVKIRVSRAPALIPCLVDAIKNANINLSIFDEVVPNPTSKNVEDALAIYHKKGD